MTNKTEQTRKQNFHDKLKKQSKKGGQIYTAKYYEIFHLLRKLLEFCILYFSLKTSFYST